MRVLFITRCYPPIIGGMEKVSYELTTHMSHLAETYIIANRRGKGFLPIFLPYALFRAIYLIKRHNIELVHLSDGFMSLLGVLIKLFCKIPVVVTAHGLDVTYQHSVYKWLVPKCIRSMDKVICISRHTQNECLKRGIMAEKCVVIPNGVNGQEFILDEPDSRLELEKILGIELSGKRILLSVGHLVKRKGVAWFIEFVMPKVAKDTIYVIIGGYGNASSGNEKEEYNNLIHKSGLQNRVFLLGEVPVRTLKLAYNTADLLIMPNIKAGSDIEGFGIVILEGGSCGLPAIASSLEGIKDAVSHGENGFLVQPGAATGYIKQINAYQPSIEFSRQVRDFTLQQFEWSSIAQRYLATFKQQIDK